MRVEWWTVVKPGMARSHPPMRHTHLASAPADGDDGDRRVRGSQDRERRCAHFEPALIVADQLDRRHVVLPPLLLLAPPLLCRFALQRQDGAAVARVLLPDESCFDESTAYNRSINAPSSIFKRS